MFSNELVFAEALQLQHYSFQLISFRTDWLDLLAVQGILKSLLQHHGSKALKKERKKKNLLLSPLLPHLFFHHFKANRWGSKGNSKIFYFLIFI